MEFLPGATVLFDDFHYTDCDTINKINNINIYYKGTL